MSAVTLTHTNGSTPHHSTAEQWLKQTAREFFGAINWDNNPPEVQELKLVAAQAGLQNEPTELSMLWSLSQFFNAINWDGAEIAAPSTTSAPDIDASAGPQKFTLEDFADLF